MKLVHSLVLISTLSLSLLSLKALSQEVDYLSFATEDEANTTEIFRKASPAVEEVSD